MDKITKFTKNQLKNKVKFRVGDTVKVHQRIKEGAKERIQMFEGLVLSKKHGDGVNGTFTVRKVASGVGVEKVFPVHSPVIEKIEVVKSGKVRSAKIYYIREATGRRGRLKEVKRSLLPEEESVDEEASEPEQKDEEVKTEIEEVKEVEEPEAEAVEEEPKTDTEEEPKKEDKKEDK